jgi:hypothetical protein
MPADPHAERLDRAARVTGEAGLGALLVTPGPDLFDFTARRIAPEPRLRSSRRR